MPPILEEHQFDDWMRGLPEQAAEMMQPCGGGVEEWEVDAALGNVRNNRAELMKRVGLLENCPPQPHIGQAGCSAHVLQRTGSVCDRTFR